MKFKILVSLISFLLLGSFSFLQARTWTISGQPQEGEFILYIPEKQVEILLDNSPVTVPLNELSKEDRIFLANQIFQESPSTPQFNLSQTAKILLFSLVGISILYLLWRIIHARGTTSNKNDQQEQKPTAIPIPSGLPYLGQILNGKRFYENSELANEARCEAEKLANRFLDVTSEKYPTLRDSKSKYIPPQAGLQNIADELNSEFTQKICAPNSFWMKKIYGINASIPSECASIVDNLLMPVRVPEGKEILLQPSAVGGAVVAALGAIIGAFAISFLASTAGMKMPGDSMVLIGTVLGTFLFSAVIFRIAADEPLRARLKNAILILGVGDTLFTILGWISSFHLFLGRNSKLPFSWPKRMALYCFVLLVLCLMKREKTFNQQDYRNQLIVLYEERIQVIVMLLALYKAQQERLILVQNDLHGQVQKLKTLLKGKEDISHSLTSVVPLIKSFWTSDVQEIAPVIKALTQEFDLLGFELPNTPIPWLSQLTGTSTSSSASRTTRPRIFRWSEVKRAEFNILGDPDDGDEVEVLREPIYQNGQVFAKGFAQEYSGK